MRLHTMKYLTLAASLLALLTTAAFAEANHPHDHKAAKGPHGGRMMEMGAYHMEFYVNAERRAEVYLFDQSERPVAPSQQTLALIAEAPTGKTKIEFETKGNAFIAKQALPEGKGYNLVLQVKPTTDGKPQNFRIKYNPDLCGECKLAEYACICEGH